MGGWQNSAEKLKDIASALCFFSFLADEQISRHLFPATVPPSKIPRSTATSSTSCKSVSAQLICIMHNKILFWSDRAGHITGYARIDVLGHSCAESILLHGNRESCKMCIGTCPVATASHSVRPAAESLLLRAQDGIKGNRATECSRAVAAAGNNATGNNATCAS